MEANELIGAFVTAFTNIINTEVAKATADLNTKVTALQDELLRLKNGEGGELDNVRITRRTVEAMIEEAMDAHANAYDHDEFITEITEYDIEDAVRNVVGGMSFEVSVS